MIKIAYIIAHTPGSIEVFFIPEILALRELGSELLIIPRDISQNSFHKKTESLSKDTLSLPWINFQIVKALLTYACKNPFSFLYIVNKVALKARNLKIALKNLIILPKAIYVSAIIQKEDISHIHAHWGTTTATMAYIMYKTSNIPWSFTLHSWDIYENNILKEKVKSASFVRCISEKGKVDLLRIVENKFSYKVKTIHMGVELPNLSKELVKCRFMDWDKSNKVFTIAVPAILLPVKGHQYLIEACSILVGKDCRNFKCIFYGDGPLKEKLTRLIKEKDLTNYIMLYGRMIPHEELMRLYADGQVDIVILPSIVTDDGAFEGIPVSLMEAMSYAIPIISTKSGGIPELISSNNGALVKPKNPSDLASAILKLIKNKEYAIEVAMRGREIIDAKFSVQKTTQFLLSAIKSSQSRN